MKNSGSAGKVAGKWNLRANAHKPHKGRAASARSRSPLAGGTAQAPSKNVWNELILPHSFFSPRPSINRLSTDTVTRDRGVHLVVFLEEELLHLLLR